MKRNSGSKLQGFRFLLFTIVLSWFLSGPYPCTRQAQGDTIRHSFPQSIDVGKQNNIRWRFRTVENNPLAFFYPLFGPTLQTHVL